MKNRISTLLIIMSSLILSCSSDLEEGYVGANYINFAKEFNKDSTYYSFAHSEGITKAKVFLNVEVASKRVEFNREYLVRYVPEESSAIEGKHFTKLPESYTLKGGVFIDSIAIEALNDTPTLDQGDKVAVFEFVPSEDFLIGLKIKSKAKLILSNKIVQPKWWDSWHEGSGLGKYSRKKYDEFIKVMKLYGRDYELDYKNNENMSYADMRESVRIFKYYLIENPTLDEDGTTMSVKIVG